MGHTQSSGSHSERFLFILSLFRTQCVCLKRQYKPLGQWLPSVWRGNCLGMQAATSAQLPLPVNLEGSVGAENEQASCYLLPF